MLAAASFALSKLVVHEKVESWIRRPFVDEGRRRPKGRRLRYAVGELLTCTRCTGAWSALGLVALRLHAPPAGRTIATVLAASAGNDMLQATFSWLCAQAKTQERAADAPEPVRGVRTAAWIPRGNGRHVMLQTARIRPLPRLGGGPPGVPGRVTTNGQ